MRLASGASLFDRDMFSCVKVEAGLLRVLVVARVDDTDRKRSDVVGQWTICGEFDEAATQRSRPRKSLLRHLSWWECVVFF